MPRTSEEDDLWIERRIITGMIVSDEYMHKVARIYEQTFLKSVSARTLAQWALTYYRQYNRTAGQDIQGIYTSHLRNGLDKETAEDIELILTGLSRDYDRKTFNVDYLLDETLKYFTSRRLKEHIETIQGELDAGSLVEAEKIAIGYSRIAQSSNNVIDPFAPESVESAFKKRAEPLFTFGKALGRMMNSQFVRGGFIAFMGPEKRGKSQTLMDIGMRAVMSNCNVAFFQAGDMGAEEQTMRICTYIAKRSADEKYCGELLIPVSDCLSSQNDRCKIRDRTSKCGLVFAGEFNEKTYDEFREIHKENEEYTACDSENCSRRQSTFWFIRRGPVEPLTKNDAKRIMHNFRRRYKKQFKLVTYANETLTISEIKAVLDTWEQTELFVPDVLIVDYLDICAPDPDTAKMDIRHQENKKWQRSRSLSQSRHCLFITATQTDTDSYKANILKMDNFSETKTKYAHVTAMYGLNQSEREKKIGIMRINEIVIREGDFDRTNAVCVLQRRQIGRPYLGSF